MLADPSWLQLHNLKGPKAGILGLEVTPQNPLNSHTACLDRVRLKIHVSHCTRTGQDNGRRLWEWTHRAPPGFSRTSAGTALPPALVTLEARKTFLCCRPCRPWRPWRPWNPGGLEALEARLLSWCSREGEVRSRSFGGGN